MTVSDEVKTLYKQDNSTKAFTAYFPTGDLTLSDKIKEESLKLVESISSGDKLVFGSCIASQIEFTTINVTDDLKGTEFEATHSVEDNPVSLGFFKVESCKKQDNSIYKNVLAYDRMLKIDVDVSAWYNTLNFTGMTLAAFRSSFLSYIGLEEDVTILPLPNDSMTVVKTIEPSQLSGRVVIEACEEINGCFGHIGRDGKFTHIVLEEAYTDYPTDDYPSDDYPVDEPHEQIEKSMYREAGIKFEEYTVKAIDKLQIRQEKDDIGAIVGTGTNAYIIQGNFLVFGKGAAELETIANNAFTNIKNRQYRPYTASLIGLPFIEVGSTVKYHTNDTVAGYVFTRTLTGTQALKDSFAAQGKEEQEQTYGVNHEIIQLKSKTAKIIKTVEEVSVSVSDLDAKLTGEIEVLAGQVVLKVNADGKIGYVELNADPNGLTQIDITADNINLNGYVGINNKVVITDDGLLKAVDAEFSGKITASTFIGGTIESENYVAGTSGMKIDLATGTIYVESGASFTSQGATYSTTINDGRINTELIEMEAFSALNIDMTHNCYFDYTGFHTDILNGSFPLTAGNFLNYFIEIKDTMTYPPATHNHDGVYQIAGNYLVSSDLSSIQTSIGNLENRVYALEHA